MLKIDSVAKTFGNKKILDAVSLNVKEGEIAVLLGYSGVGKSTLLRVLNNLESIDAGSISLNDKELDLARVSQDHIVGMLFQQFNLFDHLTVKENVTLALEKVHNKSVREANEIAVNLLKQYGLADKKDHYISELSGGQKQRVALVRTLALKPKILCLDEPTSALDPLLTNYIADVIQQLGSQGYIVLVATHDTQLLKQLDCTIYLMDGGKIVESARSHDITQSPDRYPRINQFISGDIAQK